VIAQAESTSADFDSGYAPAVASPLQVAWRRKSLVLLGLVTSLGLGTLYYIKATPVYSSSAQVLVVKKQPDAVPVSSVDGRMAVMEDYLSTHTTIIRSPEVVKRAAKFLPPEGLKSLAARQDPAAAIATALTVTREMKENNNPTNILILTGRSVDPEESLRMVDAVIKGYKEFLDETFRTVSDQTLELITQARDTLERVLAKKDNDYRKFRLETSLLPRAAGQVEYSTLKDIQSKHSAASMRAAELQDRLTNVETVLKERGREAALKALEVSTQKDDKAQEKLLESLVPLYVQLREHQENYGEKHPSVASLRTRIQSMRDAWRDYYDTVQNSGGKADPLEEKLQTLGMQLADAKNNVKLYGAMLEAEGREARRIAGLELEDDKHRNDIQRTQQLYDVIIKRLSELDLARNQGGYDARVIAPADIGKKVAPVAWQVFGGALVVGIGLGLALAYLAEYTDTTFHTPEELQKVLGAPVIGHVPVLEPDTQALARQAAGEDIPDPMLCAFHAPKSTRAEAFRGIRTALYFSTHGSGHQVIQVTSPHAADGKSTLAANLAVSIAQSGKRTVLIDADFRRPRVHKLFHVSSEVGLASAIRGDCDLSAAIQMSGVPGLWILPCGPRPSNPAELLTSPRFQEMLQEIRSKFDFVIVDTPPVLVVTDPCVVAPRVDGVVLALRLARNVRPSAERARDVFASLGANVLGVVVNGVGDGRQVYGYSTYQYGYKYEYKYDYTYDYDETYNGGNNHYYQDEEEAANGTATNGASTRHQTRRSSVRRMPLWKRLFQ
jgi:capsular exopolysaccharide synthesis family protein